MCLLLKSQLTKLCTGRDSHYIILNEGWRVNTNLYNKNKIWGATVLEDIPQQCVASTCTPPSIVRSHGKNIM